MIDFGGKGAFLRFWLPLCILAGLIALLFPPCRAKPGAPPRETWDGLVVLATIEPPPVEPLRLLVALPLEPAGAAGVAGAAASAAAGAELLVVGEAHFAPGAGAMPLLLVTPRDESGLRLSRRVSHETASPQSTRARFVVHRASAFDADPLVGALLRSGECIDAAEVRALPAPLGDQIFEIAFDPVRHRRWPGNPQTFADDWARFRDADPGGWRPSSTGE